MQLGVLKVGIGIAAVSDVASDLKLQYPEMFEGIGKFKADHSTHQYRD